MNILGQMAKSKPIAPSTPNEYMALQLARRLNDLDAFDWYIRQAGCVSREKLLKAFHGCRSVPDSQRAKHFRSLLIISPIP